MSYALATTALLMGLAGGPHCAVMCGAACGGLRRMGAQPQRRPQSPLVFQAGRLVGYSTAGAAAAAAVQSFAWITEQAAVVKPLWVLFHLAVLGWGLMLVVKASQPAWADRAGRSAWSRVGAMAASRGGMFSVGALWAFMPCSLLYSALLVASLSGGPLQGALAMAAFAAGSSVSLLLAPQLLAWLRRAGNGLRDQLGVRLAGGVLVLAAVFGLWSDMMHRIAEWCGLA
ncbi:sulfite exporter TauE/SafE family protein [Polaromonas sp. YR568]|uniref:sulfite exporter TauE/SafE family protein n=1 Tax=Polaromonas sp. YR568 TaxID=1855301 RepID=UPI00398BFBB6